MRPKIFDLCISRGININAKIIEKFVNTFFSSQTIYIKQNKMNKIHLPIKKQIKNEKSTHSVKLKL